MGESTCLFRSYSTPSESSGAAQEGDPMRVLGESKSFGRFLSENLDWEKWSMFSHNRYVEEAEKYSKPGSVAAKKAYFEAHYKKKAAEKASALVQEPNAQAGGNFDSETWEPNHAGSPVMAESEADGMVTANVQLDKDAAFSQVVDCANANQHKHDVGQNDVDISNVEEAGNVPHPCTEESLNVESCIIIDDSNQFNHVEPLKYIDPPGVEKMPDPGAVLKEVLPSPKLSTKTRAVKLLHSLNERKAAAGLPPRSGINKKSVRVSSEDWRLTAQSLCLSINLPSATVETRKTAAAAAQSKSGINSVNNSKKRVEGSIEKKCVSECSRYMSVILPSCADETSKSATAAFVKPRNVINRKSRSMKSVGDSVKRPTRSLYMSINHSSGPDETSKMASVLEHNRMEKNHSNVPNISKDHPVASQTSKKESRGFLNQASENPLSQRRSERLLNKSLSGGVTANGKLSSIYADCSRSKPRPPTKSLPFRFKSEERAIKRKEFLQRIDEIKDKEAETGQRQRTSKDKIEHDHKKLRQSSVFKWKLNEERNGGLHSPSNQIRKTSLTQLQSPKFGRKVNSGTIQDKNLPKSRKPPISTNNSKRIAEKVNQTTRQSVTSSNITRENDSPNIQH